MVNVKLVVLPRAEGCTLGQSVYDMGGHVLLAAGVRLTSDYLRRLVRLGYSAVYVEDSLAPDIGMEQAVRAETRAAAYQAVRGAFSRAEGGSLGALALAKRSVDDLLSDLSGAGGAVVTLVALRASAQHTFVHSVNVCVLSLLVGMGSGLDRTSLRQLGLGALLHDVGKAFCADLTAKTGPLSAEEWERMKRHPADGFEMLRHHPEVHLFSAHVAFQHHERLDGSGYPRGIAGRSIMPYARIAAVANAYDAMISDQPHRPARAPHEAMSALLEQAGVGLDGEVARRLARRLAVYPQGTIVRLSGGWIGAVAAQGASPDAPFVRVMGAPDLTPVAPSEVDLGADSEGRRIEAVLPDWPAPLLRRLSHRPVL